jgi:hypothetical protein
MIFLINSIKLINFTDRITEVETIAEIDGTTEVDVVEITAEIDQTTEVDVVETIAEIDGTTEVDVMETIAEIDRITEVETTAEIDQTTEVDVVEIEMSASTIRRMSGARTAMVLESTTAITRIRTSVTVMEFSTDVPWDSHWIVTSLMSLASSLTICSSRMSQLFTSTQATTTKMVISPHTHSSPMTTPAIQKHSNNI